MQPQKFQSNEYKLEGRNCSDTFLKMFPQFVNRTIMIRYLVQNFIQNPSIL